MIILQCWHYYETNFSAPAKKERPRISAKPLLLKAPPAVLFSNQFQEDLKKLYDIKEYLDITDLGYLNKHAPLHPID